MHNIVFYAFCAEFYSSLAMQAFILQQKNGYCLCYAEPPNKLHCGSSAFRKTRNAHKKAPPEKDGAFFMLFYCRC